MANNDLTSPASKQYMQDLYASIIKRGHVDFGDIPKSRGRIMDYSGFNQMKQCLDSLEGLAKDNLEAGIMQNVDIVRTAIVNIAKFSQEYRKGYDSKCDYVMCEYQVYVYMCVEATTTLIYEYVDFLRDPKDGTFKMVIKNTKFRANELYIDTLAKYNNVIKNNAEDYRKMLLNFINGGRDNFIGASTVVGAATVAVVVTSIIPLTRRAIYFIYKTRNNIADSLDTQAKFLELNATCIQANTTMTPAKKKEVIKKQQNLVKGLRKISDKLRVNYVKASKEAAKSMQDDDRIFTTRKTNPTTPTPSSTDSSNDDDEFVLL